MKYLLSLVLIPLMTAGLFTQHKKLPVLTPNFEHVFIASEQDRKDYMAINKLFEQVYETEELKEEDLTKEQLKLMDRADQLADRLTVGGIGCSWYCGGGPHRIKASSELSRMAGFSYEAENAHDFSVFTAWVEGKTDYGIGESISYYFLPNSPPITHIEILNGYLKNPTVWNNNSRVKKFKLLVNNEPYALLPVMDTTALQRFMLPDTLQSTTKGEDLVLKFEITEVYPGDKYKDVAITEIMFDGIGVH